MYLAENKTLRLITLCGFYVAQGIPWGFVTIAMKAWLAGEPYDFSEKDLGDLVAFAVLPWSFKWLWGFVVDSFQTSPMGKRRPWLIFAQVAMLLILASLIFISDITAQFRTVLWIVLAANIFVGLQDVSVDAMAVDLLTDEDRNRVSGFMYGASYFGTAIGGFGLGWVLGNFGIRAALVCQCGLLGISLMLPIFTRERRGDRFFGFFQNTDYDKHAGLAGNRFRQMGKDLLQAFSLRSTLLGALVALLVKVGYGMIAPKFTKFLRTAAGWSIEHYSEVEGLWGSIFGFTACCIGALAAQKYGAKAVTSVGLISLSSMWILVGVRSEFLQNDFAAAAVIVLQEVFLGLVSVGLFAIYCAISSPRVAAIQFTAYMAIMNFSFSLGSKLAGLVGTHLRLNQLFIVASLIQALLVIGVLMIDLQETRRVLSERES